MQIKIATRETTLALIQTHLVREAILEYIPDAEVELVPMTTEGDQRLDQSLAKIGGKGLFLKTLETALLEGRADIAVHSMKDVPVQMPIGLEIAAVLPRIDPRDALVSPRFAALENLPPGAKVGTSSLRRHCQLKAIRPDLEIQFIRGRVETRLAKCDQGEYDAVILAVAGLKRLNLADRITAYLPADHFIPAVGQAAIGVECRTGEFQSLMNILNDKATEVCLAAERAVSLALNASCHTPLGVYATLQADEITLSGMIGDVNAFDNIEHVIKGPADAPEALGETLAQRLLALGGDRLLEALDA
jgi:hydroxymethylbilane synthase